MVASLRFGMCFGFAFALTACRVSLPDRAATPPGLTGPLKAQSDACVTDLNALRSDARGAQTYADTMTIVGGLVSGAGGVTAAIIPAASSNPVSDASKAGTIVAASIAAAGAVVALLSKTADSPTIPLETHKLKEAHWIPALKAMNQLLVNPQLNTAPVQQYISARLTDCTSATPSKDVPPLPAVIQGFN